MTVEGFSIWAIYNKPRDYPDKYVARRWTIEAVSPGIYKEKATNDVVISKSLDEIRRQMLWRGLAKLDRFINDDPIILETWL